MDALSLSTILLVLASGVFLTPYLFELTKLLEEWEEERVSRSVARYNRGTKEDS
jgi:hypothetical protein